MPYTPERLETLDLVTTDIIMMSFLQSVNQTTKPKVKLNFVLMPTLQCEAATNVKLYLFSRQHCSVK